MSILKLWIFCIGYASLVSAVNSQESNKYCQLKRDCGENESHIGCSYNSLLSSGYEIEHLRYSDRLSILNQVNQFRSDISVGSTSFRDESFPNMKKIMWNYELEKLLKMSIRKVNRARFPCIITSKADNISQFNFVLLKSIHDFKIDVTFRDLFTDLIRRAVSRHKMAAPDNIVPFSYIFNPSTSAMGCAMGSKNPTGGSSASKSVYVWCAFNGTKIDKNLLNSHKGWPCSGCNQISMHCDEYFPGLCVAGNLKGSSGTKGVKGKRGAVGKTGSKGEPGPNGPDGLPGIQGYKGSKGEPGGKGEQGISGSLGKKGDKGDPGKNVTGLIGLPGLDGVPGDAGPMGARGQPGEVGDKGKDNHNKGEKGEPGTSISGDEGTQGQKGDRGLIGLKGDSGIKGEKGFSPIIAKDQLAKTCHRCKAGPPGPQGPPGPKGEKGLSYIY